MGFFGFDDKPEKAKRGYSPEFLHRHQCGVCPLNHTPGNRSPYMEATGSEEPWIYVLGEAPGKEEDDEGRQFVGKSGRLLRGELSQDIVANIRWNNGVQCRPPKNRDPTEVELECCRLRIRSDIERTRPPIIWGMGNIPLRWATRQTDGITKWRGRRVPVRIGEHVCWFFPMLHPSFILHMEGNPQLYEQQLFVFQLDIRNAIDAMDAGLPEPVVYTREDALANVVPLTSADDVVAVLDRLREQGGVHGLDLETVNTRPYGEDSCILTAAISDEDRSFAFPLYHRECPWSEKELQRVERAFIAYLTSPNCTKVQFSPLEMEFLAYFYGQQCIDTPWVDAQGQAFLIDGRAGTLSLDFLCYQHFGVNIKAINNLDVTKLDETPLDRVLLYNGMDAKFHRGLFEKQDAIIAARELDDVCAHHMERQRFAVMVQLRGVPIDQKIAKKIHDDIRGTMDQIEDEIAADPMPAKFKMRTGHDYRPGAPQDAGELFGKMLGYPGKVTDEEGLDTVDHPLAKLTVEWRHNNKTLSTYVLPAMVGNESSCIWPDGMLHPQLHLTRVRTWRTSSSEPNSQNFPNHNEFKIVRRMAQRAGFKCVSFDYGQIQGRNVAMESLDANLIKHYWDRHDTHADWCRNISEMHPRWIAEGIKALEEPKVFKKYRQEAKNKFVFPSFFGATGRSVAGYLGIPEECGVELSRMFWAEFPDIRIWQDKTRDAYHENGYVTGLSGFQRHAPVAWTEIINSPIQALETLIVCDAGIRLSRMGDERLIPNMEIHDDLTFWWEPQHIEELAPVVIDHMLNVPFEWAHVVPIAVEMSVGDNWMEKEKFGEYFSDTWEGKL